MKILFKFVNSKTRIITDYGLAVASFAWALHSHSWLWAAAGLLGLVIAWLDPVARLTAILEKKFIRKAPAPLPDEDDSGEADLSVQEPLLPAPPAIRRGILTAGGPYQSYRSLSRPYQFYTYPRLSMAYRRHSPLFMK